MLLHQNKPSVSVLVKEVIKPGKAAAVFTPVDLEDVNHYNGVRHFLALEHRYWSIYSLEEQVSAKSS